MRLVYLSDSPIPSREANGFHVMRMCQAFGQAGHEVTLIGQNCPVYGEPGIDDVFDFYHVDPVFAVQRIKRLKVKGWGLLYGWQAARMAKKQAPDLVYSRNLWGAAIVARMGLPVVFEAHTLKFLSAPMHRRMALHMMRQKSFQRLVVISGVLQEDCLAELAAMGVPEEIDLQVAHDGADLLPADFPARNFPGAAGGRLQVGYCGSLYPGKGAEKIPALAKQCPWADFHIAGGSNEALKKFQEQFDTPPNLQLHGFLPSREAASFCLGCDILLAPNQPQVLLGGPKTDIGRWTSPLKIFEYMASAKPILCSDLTVLREILTDGKTGILLPPDDLRAWARALAFLRDHPEERHRLGENARQDLKMNFTWKSRAESVLKNLAIMEIGND